MAEKKMEGHRREVDGIIIEWWGYTALAEQNTNKTYNYMGELSSKTIEHLTDRIQSIKGVTFASGARRDYEISVFIGECYSWDTIEPIILAEIQKALLLTVDDYVSSKCFHCGK